MNEKERNKNIKERESKREGLRKTDDIKWKRKEDIRKMKWKCKKRTERKLNEREGKWDENDKKVEVGVEVK